MNTPTQEPLDAVLTELADTRAQLDDLTAQFKALRIKSRRLTLALITEHGYSIFKAAAVSGHQRATIMAWLGAAGIGTR